MSTNNTITLKCEMTKDCAHPVTHLDSAGWIYCTDHGIRRKAFKQCRPLTQTELSTLEMGLQIDHF